MALTSDGADTALARALLASGVLDAATLRRALDEVRAARGGADELGLAAWLLERRVLEPDALEAARSAVGGPAAPPAAPLLQLGPYRVVRPLGQGGMGAVHEVEHVGTGVRYALKVHTAGPADDEGRERFRREVEALGRLRHPNVVAVHAADLDGAGVPYVVQELVPGGSLTDRLRDRGPLPVAEAVALAARLARALAHAHAAGVLHRDLKPANVLLAERGPCLADFGLARLVGHESLTRTGEALGTPAYMAPEQIVAPARVGPATDVYGLGATLFSALTGRPPFEGASVWNVLDRVLRAPPPSARALRPEVPPALDALVAACLAKAPGDRPPSAAALADQLDALGREAPARGRGGAVLALVAVAAAGLGAAWASRAPAVAGAPSVAPSTTSAAPAPAPPPPPPPPSQPADELVILDGARLGEAAEVRCAWLARLEPEGLRARGSQVRWTGPGASFLAAPETVLEVEAELDLLLLDEPLSLDLLLARGSVEPPVGLGIRLTTTQGGPPSETPVLHGELITCGFETEKRDHTAWRERRCGARVRLRLRWSLSSGRCAAEWTLGDGEPLAMAAIVLPPDGEGWRLLTRVGGIQRTPTSPLPVCDVRWRRLVVRAPGGQLSAAPDDGQDGRTRLAARALVEGAAPADWATPSDTLSLDAREECLRTAAALAAQRGDQAGATAIFRRLWDAHRDPQAQLTPVLSDELGLYSAPARRALALAWLDYWTGRKSKLRRDDEYLIGVARRGGGGPGHVLFHLLAASDAARAGAPLIHARALAERGDPEEAWAILTRARQEVPGLDSTDGLAFDVAYRLDRFEDAAREELARPSPEQLARQARARALSGLGR